MGGQKAKAEYQYYVPKAKPVENWYKNFNFILLDNMEDLKKVFEPYIGKRFYMGFDTETTGLDFEKLDLVGYSFTLDGKNAYYVPVYHFQYEHNLGEESVQFIYDMMCKAYIVFMYNARYDMRVFEFRGYKDSKENRDKLDKDRKLFVKYDMSKVNYFDVAVPAWLVDTNRKMPSLKVTSSWFLGFEQMHFDEVIENAGNFFYLNPTDNPNVTFYAASDALCTYLLVPKLMKYYKESGLAGKLDNKVLYPLMHCEEEKIWIDGTLIDGYVKEATEKVKKLENEVYDMVGYQLNLNSPIQVGQAFSRLGIDTGEKTASGNMAVGIKVLDKLPKDVVQKYPALKSYIEYKETAKLLSAYITVFKKEYERNGFLRGAYKTNEVPCLTENNYVCIKDRGIVSIKDVKENDYIWTQYGYKKVLWNHSHEDETFRVYLKNSSYVEGNSHHPILVNTTGRKTDIKAEWSSLIALKEKEHIIMNSHAVTNNNDRLVDIPTNIHETDYGRKKVEKPTQITKEFARLIGYLDGDGCLLSDRIRLAFNTKEKEVIAYYTKLFENTFKGIGKPNIYVDGNSTTYDYFSTDVVKYLTNLNVKQKLYDGVSKYIMSSEPVIWCEYIMGLFDTDGYVGINRHTVSPRFKNTKKGMTYDVYRMLQFMSIDSSIYVRDKSKEGNKTQYEIEIIGTRGLDNFLNNIGSKLVNNLRRNRCIKGIDLNKPYRDIWQVMADRIEYTGKQTVYDIEVEDVHEYIANGIVSHNTGRLAAGKDSKNTYFSPLNLQSLPKPHVSMDDVYFLGDRNLFSKKKNIIAGYQFVPSQYDKEGKHIVPNDKRYIGQAEGMNQTLNIRSLVTPKMYKDSNEDEWLYGSFDYAAEELRIASNVSREPVWMNAFLTGMDVHESCYYPDTEFLTRNGFRTYKDINEDTEIAEYDDTSDSIKFVKAGKVYFNDTKDFVSFKSNHIDLLVTGNHRMYVYSGNRWGIRLAEEQKKLSRTEFKVSTKLDNGEIKKQADFIEFPASTYRDSFKISINDFCQLIGYIITDGGTCKKKGGQRVIYFCQSEVKENVLRDMQDLNCRLNNLFKERVEDITNKETIISGRKAKAHGKFHTFSMASVYLYDYIVNNFGGSLKKDRYLPNWFMSLPIENIRHFLQSVLDCDGEHDNRKNRNYIGISFQSKRLCDDFQILMFRMGHRAIYHSFTNENGTTMYRMSITFNTDRVRIDNRNCVKDVHFDNTVRAVCYSVPTGLLVVRRNGKIAICGNTAKAIWGAEKYNRDYRKKAKACFSIDDYYYTNHGAIKGKYLNPLEDRLIDMENKEQDFNYFIEKRDGYEIELSNGMIIHTTKDHKFHVIDTYENDRWITADDIETGRGLGLRPLTVFGDYQYITLDDGEKIKFDEDMAYLMGYILGDGSIEYDDHNKRLSLLAKSFNREYLYEVMSRVGNNNHVGVRKYKGKDYVQLFAYNNLVSKRMYELFGKADTKHISDIVYCSPKSVMMSFLAGLMDSDSKINKTTIEYQSSNEKLIRGISLLVSLLGYTVISFKKNEGVLKAKYRDTGKEDYKIAYYVLRIGFEDIVKEIPILNPKNQKYINERVKSSIGYTILESDRSRFKEKYTYKQVGNFTDGRSKKLSKIMSKNIGDWRNIYIPVEIVRKEPTQIDTMCLECSTHKFIGNCLDSLNCNFGILYGMGASSLFTNPIFGFKSMEEANEFYEHFKKSLPTLFSWEDRTQRRARRQGYIQTFFGRPRRLKSYYDTHNFAFANRTACNTLIQGCIIRNTKILTNKGYIEIGKLYDIYKTQEDNSENVMKDYKVWNGFMMCDFYPVYKGKYAIGEITFSNGQKFKCDTRHEIKVIRGNDVEWVHFKDLKIGDKVCYSMLENHVDCGNYVTQIIGEHSKSSGAYKEDIVFNREDIKVLCYIYGSIIGDGHLSNTSQLLKEGNRIKKSDNSISIVYGKSKFKNMKILKDFCDKHSIHYYERVKKNHVSKSGKISEIRSLYVYCKPLVDALCKLTGDKGGKNVYTKRIGENVYTLDRELVGYVLKGIYDTDGIKKTGDVHLVNEQLIRDIQLLYRYFGYSVRVSQTTDKSWWLKVHNIPKFVEEINAMRFKNSVVSKYTTSITDYHRHILRKLGKNIDKSVLTRSERVVYYRVTHGGSCNLDTFRIIYDKLNSTLENKKYFEDYDYYEITDIKELGYEDDTYTLAVLSELHQFDTEGIISHNTGGDILKIVICRLWKNLFNNPKYRNDVKWLVTIHDEIGYAIRASKVCEISKVIMDNQTMRLEQWPVPIITEPGLGWSMGHVYDFHTVKDDSEVGFHLEPDVE